MKIFNNIFIFIMVFFIFACSNTRVVMEGVKKVINNQEEEKPEKNKSNIYSKGHYKIGKPYTINNITYTPKLVSYYNENGIASWYGPKFHQKPTANGEIFDQNKISAAHKTLPLPSIVKVTNLKNKKSVYIRVNDRGPFVNNRIIDLSKKAAIELNIFTKGIENVNVTLIESGPHLLEKNFIDQKYLEEYARNLDKKKNQSFNKTQLSTYLQLGVFSLKENAIRYKSKIMKIYNSNNFSFLINDYSKAGKSMFKVILGPFENNEIAKNVADNLLELGYNSILITMEDN